MKQVKLPSIICKKTQEYAAASYESSYSRDYCPKGVLVRVPRRTGSASRKHNPQPRNVFLLRRMFNEPVCNVWTKQSPHSLPTPCPPKSCAQTSFPAPSCAHPNFAQKPTRFGSSKSKPKAALGIVPAVNIYDRRVVGGAVSRPSDKHEPLCMDIKGKKRVISAAYVLDQQLPQFRAVEDMKCRAKGSLDFYLSHAVRRPSRRKHIKTRPTCLTGSSIKVMEMTGNSGSCCDKIRPLIQVRKTQPSRNLPPCTCIHKLNHNPKPC